MWDPNVKEFKKANAQIFKIKDLGVIKSPGIRKQKLNGLFFWRKQVFTLPESV